MPVNKILVDTSFIVALINERDQYHEHALKSVDKYDGQSLVITDGVLLEVANALARGYKTEAIQVIENFLSADEVDVIHLTPDLFGHAFDLYKTHQDKSWGLVDCISFVVMRDRGIRLALTFDKHFIQAGFQVIPSVE